MFYFIFRPRVFLSIENPARFTIYCHIKAIDNVYMEIRVLNRNSDPTVFASSRVCGKMALIPVVFLDPNYNETSKS